jgi:hypothetical protein
MMKEAGCQLVLRRLQDLCSYLLCPGNDDSDIAKLIAPAFVDPRNSIFYGNHAKVPFTRFVDGGSRAIREVTASKNDGRNAILP